jgi:flagellar biosynthesis protein FlhA
MKPRAVLIASGMLALLGIVPGLPTLPFLGLSAAAAALGLSSRRSLERTRIASEVSAARPAAPSGPAPVDDLLVVDALEVEIGYGLIGLVDATQGGDLLERISMIRRQLATELGFVVPPVHVRDSIQLKPSQYRIRVKGVAVGEAEIDPEKLLAMNPGSAAGKLRGLSVREPAFGLPATWIARGERETADRQGWTVVEPAVVIATHLTEVIKRSAPELLGRQEVRELVEGVKGRASAVVEELIPSVMSIGAVQKVLAGLLRERVSIRDLVTILETLADHAGAVRDVHRLVDLCRIALGRAICDAHKNPDGTIVAVTLSPKVENVLGDAIQTQTGEVALEPATSQRLVDRLAALVQKAVSTGSQPVVITSGRVRAALRRLIEPVLPHVAVLSFAEIVSGTPVTSIGQVKLDHESN